MSVLTPYVIPPTPPTELLAELDAAAQTLDALSARAAELTLAMDDQAHGLHIELTERGTSRTLRPAELLELLTGT